METLWPVLLALQATTDGIDDGTLDAMTLVLLVGFVVSLVALTVLLARKPREPVEEPSSAPESPAAELPPASAQRARAEARSMPGPGATTPVWLAGVELVRPPQQLSEATSLVERLLEARRAGKLDEGVALYSAPFRAKLAEELGVSEDGLRHALAQARIEGDVPVLRAVELVSSTEGSMTVRVGYADRTSELYRLVRHQGSWAIDSIERA